MSIDPKRLAAALAKIGSGDLDRLVWSPHAFEFNDQERLSEVYIDETVNELAEDQPRYISLARAILHFYEQGT